MKYLFLFFILAGCKHYKCVKSEMVDKCIPNQATAIAMGHPVGTAENIVWSNALCIHQQVEECSEYVEIK